MPGEAIDRHFIAALIGERAEDASRASRRDCDRWHARGAGAHHLLGPSRNFIEIHTHDGGRRHAEIGERGITAADARQRRE